uniref:PfkB domain-containing protein n=1 Tax=Macrostomum lignano TaxID=282301 RepID=A0A1I8I0I4_9PLAT
MLHTSGSIICVGLCCLDLVSKVDQFPMEDTDSRANISWQLGGNAAHNAIVLAALESKPVYFAGTMPSENSFNGNFIRSIFAKHSIDTSLSQSVQGDACPVSMVIVNTEIGSRTILHDRGDLPEFSFDQLRDRDFASADVGWIHFEGRRNVSEIAAMLSHIRALNQRAAFTSSASVAMRIRTSVELEKCRPELTSLLGNCDVIFLSKEFASFHGAADKVAAVRMFLERVDVGATVICAWGELGCAGAVRSGGGHGSDIISVPAAAPDGPVVDTLGAGDSFVAACLHGLRAGRSLAEALRLAAAVAGAKCARADGFSRVADWAGRAAELS